MNETATSPTTLPGRSTGLSGSTTRQVAERFKVCDETVRRWARGGRIPAYRAGVYRYDIDAVEEALRLRGEAEDA